MEELSLEELLKLRYVVDTSAALPAHELRGLRQKVATWYEQARRDGQPKKITPKSE